MTEKTIAGETAQSSALDVELAQVLEACLAELEAGNLPDRQALIAQHPAIAERLEACLNNLRFIEHVSMEESSNAPARTLIDSSGHLGDFRILCEIGRGGMGVVYEAEQISLRRRVALKVLPFAAVLDGRQLQRFKNEAQAAAVLKHPNIVGVHCVGCERGVHFYAMELVEGHSLAEVIQQLRDGISGESRVESRELRVESPGPEVGPESRVEGQGPEIGRGSRVQGRGPETSDAAATRRRSIARGEKSGEPRVESGEPEDGTQPAATRRWSIARGEKSGESRVESGEPEDGTQPAATRRPSIARGETPGDAAPQPTASPERATENESDATAPSDDGRPADDPPADDRAAAETLPIAALSTECDTRSPGYFRTVARLGIQAAEALEYAHQLGIVHRDIKPSNLLVEEGKGVRHHLCEAPEGPSRQMVPDPFSRTSPHLWITDFGLAHVFNSQHSALDSPLTMSGDLLGTLRYMSPEQASGRRTILDHRTDIYSLGVTLYELATLQPAFPETDRAKLLRDILEHDPPAPRAINAAIPRDLETIILKSTSKEPSARYDSAQELADDLHRFLTQKPIHARRTTRPERLWRWCRRNPLVASLTAAVLALMAILAIAGPVVAVKYRSVARAESLAKNNETASKLALEREIDDKRLRLYVQDMKVADEAWKEGNLARVAELLEQYFPKPGEVDLRCFAWHHLWGRYQQILRIPTLPHPAVVNGVEFSPDGQRVYSACADGLIRMWDTASTMPMATGRYGHAGGAMSVAVSPDGRWVASGGIDGVVHLWEAATFAHVAELAGHAQRVDAVCFSPDSQLLATGGTDVDVILWDVESRTRIASLSHTAGAVMSLAFSPAGETLAAATAHSSVVLWDVHGNRQPRILFTAGHPLQSVAFSADGRHGAFACLSGEVGIWETESQRIVSYGEIHTADPHSLVFLDGQTLAAACIGGTVRIWNMHSRKLLNTILAHPEATNSIAVGPGGTRLASAGNDATVKLWDLTEFNEPALTARVPRRFNAVALSGASLLASAQGEYGRDDGNGWLYVWDLHTRGCRKLDYSGQPLMAAAFSPVDPNLLVTGGGRYAEGPGMALVWDLARSRPIRTLTVDTHQVWAVAFSPDGHWLATGDNRFEDQPQPTSKVRVWRVGTWEKHVIPGTDGWNAHSLRFISDGRLLAAGVQHSPTDTTGVKLWDTLTWQEAGSILDTQSTVLSIDATRDARLLAVRCLNGETILWDVAKRKKIRTIADHLALGTALSLSPDGRTLATSGFDGRVKLWNVATGGQLATLEAHPTVGAATLEFSDDGRLLVAGVADGNVVIWRADGTREVLVPEEKLNYPDFH